MKLKVTYYAVFREQSGLNSEEIETDCTTPGELYDDLCQRYGFKLPPGLVRAAVNGSFQSMESELKPGDEIVFIPPVAGG